MRARIFIILLIVSVSFCHVMASSVADKANLITTQIEQYHFSPREFDAEYLSNVKKLFLQSVDPYLQTLIVTDSILTFSSNVNIGGDFTTGLDTFLLCFEENYTSRLLTLDSVLRVYKQTPIQFNEKKEFSFLSPREKLPFSPTIVKLCEKKLKLIQYKVLLNLASEYDSLYKFDKQAFQKKVEEVKHKVIDKELCKIASDLHPDGGLSLNLQNQFYNAIASAHDPHTAFFSSEQKAGFQAQISREDYSYGLYLEEDENGDIVILYLAPGGAAWNSNKLNKGDKILSYSSIKQNADSLLCDNLEQLNELLFTSAEKKISITVEKQGGKIVTVDLQRTKLVMEENLLHSYVLSGKSKIGYVSLPGFYTEWDKNKVNGCANDLAKEILKLKKDSVSGLIIDLRNNGGGSMLEALNLAGIFINEGPLCYSRYKGQLPITAKDLNRGTIYDGPIVVIINSYSASASELFAAILQDYNRAVIVGSTTFGKASIQSIFSLPGSSDFMKMTIGKFYRINGYGHQSIGVQPDIFLQQDTLKMFRECDYPCAFKNDSVASSPYFKPLSLLPIKVLQDKYIQYNSHSERKIDVKSIYEEKVSLQIDAFMSFYKRISEEDDLLNNAKTTVHNNRTDLLLYQLDNFKKIQNDAVLSDISKDIVVSDAYFIINEMVNTK